MAKKYDLAVFIGRFQPFHNGHLAVINEALGLATKVAIIIGSANAPRTFRNPFTVAERIEMIRGAIAPASQSKLHFVGVEDTIYNDELWIKNVQAAVESVFQSAYGSYHPMAKVTLIGHSKDNTSFYLKLFPQWASTDVANYVGLSSTDIRDEYFDPTPGMGGVMADKIPFSTRDFLMTFWDTKDYKVLCEERAFVQKYKESWKSAPFPPMFVTVDAVVVQSGHILLVQRGARPGLGLWALPGGFLNQDERIEHGILRELREETKIKVPAPVLKGNIVKREVFDDPNRSSRGRTITHAALIHLPASEWLPKIKGSDDAQDARWFPLASVTRQMMYEDHYDIILNMTANL